MKNFSKKAQVKIKSDKETIQSVIEILGKHFTITDASPFIPNAENDGYHVFVNLRILLVEETSSGKAQ